MRALSTGQVETQALSACDFCVVIYEKEREGDFCEREKNRNLWEWE